MSKNKTVGIDLGTTNSAVAYHDERSLHLVESTSGHVLMPSVVAVDKGGKFTVGHHALRKLKRDFDPEFVFSNIKKQIGMPAQEGEDYTTAYGPQIVAVNGERHFIGPNKQTYSPTELSAEILKSLKASADRKLKKPSSGVVITVPAAFDNNRILDTKEAGLMAGFKRVIIKTEPEMAALAFGLHKTPFTRFGVFDLGGGTFDIAHGTAAKGDINIEPPIGEELGGTDFDKAVWRYLAAAYQQDEGKDLDSQPIAKLKLMPTIEEAKRELTDLDNAFVRAQGIYIDYEGGGTRDLQYTITREKFDELTKHLVDKTIELTKRLLERDDKTPRDFDEILLVGGMTRVPAVRKAIEDFFGKARIRDDVNPDYAVVMGAAIAAAQEDDILPRTFNFSQSVAFSFGLEDEHGNFAVALPVGAAPGEIAELVVTTAQDGQASIPIGILQGDAGSKAKDCVRLTRYEHRVQPGPAEKPRISVEFMVDNSGQLTVTGRDQQTNQSFPIREP